MEEIAASNNQQLVPRLRVAMVSLICDFAYAFAETSLELSRFKDLLSLLNVLTRCEESRHQSRLLETIMTKWLTDERAVSGQNEAVFGITLLTQYDKVSLISRLLDNVFDFETKTDFSFTVIIDEKCPIPREKH